MLRSTPDPGPVLIRVFGGPTALRGGEALHLTPLQRALLGLVFGRDHPSIQRPALLALLWPDEQEPVARRRLNQLLYSLRARAGAVPLLVSQGDLLLAPPAQVHSELEEFRESLRATDLARASALLQQGFLSQFPREAPREAQDWVEARRVEIESRLRAAASSSWVKAEEAGDWRAAGEAARVLLALNPESEGHLRRLMEALARSGRVAEAEAAYLSFSQRVAGEDRSPWVPAQETAALREKIQGAESSPGIPSYHPSSEGPTVPPLCGRQQEVAHLRRCVRRTPAQQIQVALITGEAGIGKTRLTAEALRGIHLDGQRVSSAHSTEMERLIPLNPLVEALGHTSVGRSLEVLEEPWRSVLYGVMPGHFRGSGPIPEAPPIQPGSIPRRLFEAFQELFQVMVKEKPMVLLIEDLQWVDDTTLTLLDFLIKRWEIGALQFVFTLRSEHGLHGSALKGFLETVRGHRDLVEVPLEELSPTAAEELIRSLSAEPVGNPDVERIRALAGGNPFFLMELTFEHLAGRLEAGVATDDLLPIPYSISQVLSQRLAQLSEEAELLLGALAVHVHPLSIHETGRVAKLSVPRCLSGLDQLHFLRLIARTEQEVGIPHELIRQTVYQGLSETRRAWLHERVARHLLKTRKRPPIDELALHFHRASIVSEARQYALSAADHAEESGAVAEALRFLRIARDNSRDPSEIAVLIGRMGHLNYLHRNLLEAAPLLEIASKRCRAEGRISEALIHEIERIDSLAHSDLLPLPECLEELRRIKDEAQAAGDWDAFTTALDVEVHHRDHVGDIAGVRTLLEEARQCMDLGGPRAQSLARAVLAYEFFFAVPADGLLHARSAVSIAENNHEEDLLLLALNRLLVVLIQTGQLDSEEGALTKEKAHRLGARSGDLMQKFHVHQNVAVWHLDKGEYDIANHLFGLVEAIIRGSGAHTAWINYHYNLGELYFWSHDIDRAEAAFRKAETLHGGATPRMYRGLVTAGLGLCALHRGDLHQARILEQRLQFDDTLDHFDSSLIHRFKARILDRSGKRQEAINHLEAARVRMANRLLMAWMKLTLEEARLQKKISPMAALRTAHEGKEFAIGLGLTKRVLEFTEML